MLIVVVAVSCWLMYIKLIYFSTIWESTGFYFRLIKDTIADALVFFLMYLVLIITFSNSMYILNKFRIYENPNDTLFPRQTGTELVDSMIFIYTQSIGEFGTENYTLEYSEGEITYWLFFMVTTFLTTIVFFNMLINIMGKTLDKLSEEK